MDREELSFSREGEVMSRQLNFDFVNTETVDLSHMRCDLSGLSAENAARRFHDFLCEIAKLLRADPPRLYLPGSREEAGLYWWVVWEDSPWPEWAITGGGWVDGPLTGWESLRNGVHNPKPELGPFFRQGEDPWYIETYWGFDAVFCEA
jgi:hypothetical protein